MNYKIISTGDVFPRGELSARFPNISFAPELDDEILEFLGLEELSDVPGPAAVPQSVTMRQARLALLAAGKLADVDAAIATLPSPQKEAAEIEWGYASEVQRGSATVALIGIALGYDSDELDALFVQAELL